MTPIMWALIMLALAIGVIVLEMVVPSGGLLGVLAVALAVASIFIVFRYQGFFAGSIYVLVVMSILPIAIATAIRYWPYTTMGKRMLNLPPIGEDMAPTKYDSLQEFVGQMGIAESKMIPSGTITFAGNTYDAISDSGAILPGTPVEIVAVDGTRIVVRATTVNSPDNMVSQPPGSTIPASPNSPDNDPPPANPFEEPLL